MLKSYRRSFYFRLLFSDALSTMVAWFLAYYVRFYLMEGDSAGWAQVFTRLTFLAVTFNILFFHFNQLYRLPRVSPWYQEVLSIFFSIVQATLMIVVTYYYMGPLKISRGHLVLYLVFCEFFIVMTRMLFRNWVAILYKKGKMVHRVILAGSNRQILNYVETIQTVPDLGYRFEGWVDSSGAAKKHSIPEMSIDEAIEKAKNLGPEFMILGYSQENEEEFEKLIQIGHTTTTPVIILPNLPNNLIGSTVDDFLGIPLIRINQPQERFFEGFIKRSADMVFSLLGLIVLSPMFLLIAILIKLSSRGPVFFKQERMTIDGDRFNMYKFRTMKVFDDGQNETGWTVKGDPRVTSLGAFLRRTSLDEFPQLWNVFVGTMSLVGPRPERPMYVEQFRESIPAYMLRHRMKGGITGWAQVNGWRGDTSIEKRVEYDLFYIRNWSLWFDVKILFLTVIKGFVNKNAY